MQLEPSPHVKRVQSQRSAESPGFTLCGKVYQNSTKQFFVYRDFNEINLYLNYLSCRVQLDAQTADDGTDFIVPLTRTVTFSPGSNRADITINIIDDDIIEATETFFADLAGIGSKVILGSPQRTTVFIQDNDSKSVSIFIHSRTSFTYFILKILFLTILTHQYFNNF
jgi:hypothetical protein